MAYVLFTKNGKSELCGGVFVKENWLLTAYHCVNKFSPSNANIVAGVLNGRDGSSSTGVPPRSVYTLNCFFFIIFEWLVNRTRREVYCSFVAISCLTDYFVRLFFKGSRPTLRVDSLKNCTFSILRVVNKTKLVNKTNVQKRN